MKMKTKTNLAALVGVLAFAPSGARAEDINTRIGKLSFENGIPSKESMTKLYDEMDLTGRASLHLGDSSRSFQ